MARLLTPPSTTIASLWRRLGAMLYDSVVLIGLWIFLTFLVTAAFGIEHSNTALNPYYRLAIQLTVLGSSWFFYGWFWTASGQTLGMQAWKIRVQNSDGSVISWRQASLRFVTAPFAFAGFGIGYLWMLGDSQQRTWPDLASGTVVVKIENFSKQTVD